MQPKTKGIVQHSQGRSVASNAATWPRRIFSAALCASASSAFHSSGISGTRESDQTAVASRTGALAGSTGSPTARQNDAIAWRELISRRATSAAFRS